VQPLLPAARLQQAYRPLPHLLSGDGLERWIARRAQG